MTPPNLRRLDYEGRRFHAPDGDHRTVAVYHQQGDLVWGEVAGGTIQRGWTAGTRQPDGTLAMGYTFVLTDGQVVCGRTHNTPTLTPDGRIRLHETWERYGPHPTTGTSTIEEVTP
ncbi:MULTISPECIES: hypothetical protein [Kitasatospora]|uniref:Uncharacterized protein n=1 Tax=Kitasatospora setae (strain ATCC 33774 / DSM 43861 / JCM 3304 / KCC A-0304 / NBRC 14216 / KM-6054) TaxID=452652 RepID=E4N8S2_KITSK|nr:MULTISPECIES: hypothetical protein [Kitasatospora]BAJ27603.1 hypothetical protein KSE_17790 [Kitasatospora setae KM-6054]